MEAILLINLGTPNSTHPRDVRTYLDEFLMDPFVLDINYIARFFLVKGIILNTRPKKSAEAYEKIWTDRGSPLLFHSEDLLKKVQNKLPQSKVKLAMRYGKPSIQKSLEEFKAEGVTKLKILPLYPQYSLAATASSIEKCKELAKKINLTATLTFVEDFYENPEFIKAFSENIQNTLSQAPWDFVLFSYHGIPERHVLKTDPSKKHCLASPTCCDKIVTSNRYCYKAQCYATTRSIVKSLNISEKQHSVSFQSRLGRTPWIKPYTDEVLKVLADQGVKDLVVCCPAFVADCLETLEEISMRAEKDFVGFGGRSLRLVPSLNSNDTWANAVCEILLTSA